MNRVRCRPPRNKLADHPYALEQCDHWTSAELGLYNPAVVVLMGATAIEWKFGKVLVRDARRMLRTTEGRTWLATYHPAAALRNPNLETTIEEDLRLARELWMQYSSGQ